MIKKTLLASACGFIALTGFSQSEVSSAQPYEGSEIGVSPVAEHYWVYGNGANGLGFYHDFNGWKFLQFEPIKYGNPKDINGDFGKLDVVTDKGVLVTWSSPNPWIKNAGITDIKDIDREGNNFYVLGAVLQADGTTKKGIFKANLVGKKASDWSPVLVDQVGSSLTRMDIDNKGKIYGVNAGGQVYTRNADGTNPTYISGTPAKSVKDIYVTNSGTLYIQDNYGAVYKYNAATNQYEDAKWSGQAFGVSNSGNVYGINNGKIELVANGVYKDLTGENPNEYDADGNTAITKAVLLNSQSLFDEAVQAGADVNYADRSGNPPIVLAVKNDKFNMVLKLAQAGANMDNKDASEKTALYYASQVGNTSMMNTLLTNGADPNQTDVIDVAVRSKNQQVINTLAANNADLSHGLLVAAELNDVQMFQSLTVAGAKTKDIEPFKKAVEMNNLQIATLCLDHGTDPNEAIKIGTQKKNNQVINLCLTKGANPNNLIGYVVLNSDVELANILMNNHNVSADVLLDGSLPEHKEGDLAMIDPSLPVAEAALKNGAQPNDHIPYAVSKKQKNIVEMLLNYGGDANLVLEPAVEGNDTEMAQLAIQRGALANKPELLLVAVTNKNHEMANLLLDNGAPVTDPQLMEKAVANNDLKMVEMLVNKGASPTLGIKTAVSSNFTEVAMFLLNNGASAMDPDLIGAASKNGNMQLVTKLVSMGASPDGGVKPALVNRRVEVLKYLVSKGGNASTPEHMYLAVRTNNQQIVDIIRNAGAPGTWKDATGANLLHLACGAPTPIESIIQTLVDMGVALEDQNSDGRTPLMVAANNGRNEIGACKILVDAGANVNAEDYSGKSVYRVADGRRLKKYLKSVGAKR